VPLAVAGLLALRARFADDPELSESLAATAEHALSSPDLRRRSAGHPELAAMVFASKGIALTRQGHLQEARDTFETGIGAAQEAECDPLLIECLGYLALIACVAGDLARADRLASRALEVAERAGIREADRSAAPQVARAWAAVERYELQRAVEQVRSAERSDFILGDPVPRSLLALVKSRLQVAQGDRTGALARVEQGAAALTDKQRWLVERLHLEAARLRVLGGEPRAALRDLEDLSEAHADVEVALVAMQAQRRLDETPTEAVRDVVLARKAPAAVRVSGWLVECAHHLRRGSTSQAHECLRSALQLAAGIRLRRPFHEASGPVRQLLMHDAQLTAENAWLFDVAGAGAPTIPHPRVPQETEPGTTAEPVAPVENLTPKELEVLGHLAEMLTTEEIAAVMYVSINTVRTHVRNILRKLGVNRRHAAVRLARELDLLPTGTPTA
jgi:LuxR family maltose regulon positive regulatory protein